MTSDDVPIKKGKPESFGWLRRKELEDREGVEVWERPDGGLVRMRPGTLVIRGPGKFGGLASRFKRGK